MENKSLKYFMRNAEPEIVTVPGPESFKDEEGNVLSLEIRVLTQTEMDKINEGYRKRAIALDKRNNPLVANGEVVWKTTRDNARASRHMIVEALQYPNLKAPELMEHYHCVDATDMPRLVFSKPGEYQYVSRVVMQALGLMDSADDEKELEDAKN